MEPRRLVLSRKGFDSSSGGCPSPIFPDGTMLSLPIPDDSSRVAFRDLRHNGLNVGDLVADLTRNRIGPSHRAHLDPDIDRDAYPRSDGWRPQLGTSHAAQGHLRKHGVGAGDVFLFFGLYQRVVQFDGHWRLDGGAPRQHVLWGWLQVGDIHPVDATTRQALPWAADHPHLTGASRPANTLYVAADHLDIGNGPMASGAGAFRCFDERLALTAPNEQVTHWRLPRWFHPNGGRPPLTYHGDRGRWRLDDNCAYLRSVGRGQEFILDLEHYPEALAWLSRLIRDLGAY